VKTIKLGGNNLKKTLEDGRTSHVHELAELILWKWLYYVLQCTDPMDTHKNSFAPFHRMRIINPKAYMEKQKVLNSQNIHKQKRTTLTPNYTTKP
jgi:hypothetical protein